MSRSFPHMAKLIRSYRTKAESSISQSDLSESVGYKNGQFISNVERGLCSVPTKKASVLCETLGIPKDEFLGAITEDFKLNATKEFESGQQVNN